MKENSREEDIALIEKSLCDKDTIIQYHYWVGTDFLNAVEKIVADYKRVLKENEELLEVKVSASAHNRILELEKENEELTINNKEIDKECSRLEEKEVKLINENEHYKDLIYALETYYNITREDLEKCMKNDR